MRSLRLLFALMFGLTAVPGCGQGLQAAAENPFAAAIKSGQKVAYGKCKGKRVTFICAPGADDKAAKSAAAQQATNDCTTDAPETDSTGKPATDTITDPDVAIAICALPGVQGGPGT